MLETTLYPFRDHTLDVESRLDDLLGRLTLEEKISLMPTAQAAVERLQITEFTVGGEAAHGIAWLGKATSFPQPIGMSSTWNPDLMREIGNAMGKEARVYYRKLEGKQGLTLWAPTIDLERDPRWGRTEEGYGEDPYLTSMMSRGLVEGMQGDHPVYKLAVSTLKHFYGNNNEKDRLTASANIDNRNKYEYYIRPFRYAVQHEGAYSLMPAYNSVNGMPCIIDPDLNRLVKQEWGLRGYIVGDAGDMKMLVDFHHYCETYAEAVALAVKNGVDSINDKAELVVSSIGEALQEGRLTELDLDNALRNIFRTRMQLGEFDPEGSNPYDNIPDEVLCCPEHSRLSLLAAKESIVLLKNSDGILPLNKTSIRKLAVIGPLSDTLHRDWYSGDFPYTVTPLQGITDKFQSVKVDYSSGSDWIAIRSRKTGKYLTIDEQDGCILKATGEAAEEACIFEVTDWGWGKFTLQSILNRRFITAKGNKLTATAEEVRSWFVMEAFNIVKSSDGSKIKLLTWNDKTVAVHDSVSGSLEIRKQATGDDGEEFEICLCKSGIEEAKKTAAAADAVIYFAGNHPLINGKEDEDRPGIQLPVYQEALIRELRRSNENLIVFVIGSYPFAMCGVHATVPAILYSAHGSQELGNAVAEVLCGEYSPSGKLPMTWYKGTDQLPDIMDYDIIKGGRTYMYFSGEPLYPFGYGLTYASFEYSQLQLSAETVYAGEQVTVNCTVENTGHIAGDEVVQLYVKSLNSGVRRPIKELKSFRRVHIQPGEKVQLEFQLHIENLAFWDPVREQYAVHSGTYSVMAGSSSQDIRISGIIEVIGEPAIRRNLQESTKAENYDDYNNVLIQKGADGEQSVRATGKDAWIMFDNIVPISSGCLQIELFSTNPSGEIELHEGHAEGPMIGRAVAGNIADWTTIELQWSSSGACERIYICFSEDVYIKKFKIVE